MELADSLGYGRWVKSIAVDVLEIRKGFREYMGDIRIDNRINDVGLSGWEMEEHIRSHISSARTRKSSSPLFSTAWAKTSAAISVLDT